MEEKAPAHAGSRPHHTYFVLAGYLRSLAYSVWRRTGRPMGGHAQPQHYLQGQDPRSEEHTSELQSLMRSSYAVFCLKNKNKTTTQKHKTPKKTSINNTPNI